MGRRWVKTAPATHTCCMGNRIHAIHSAGAHSYYLPHRPSGKGWSHFRPSESSASLGLEKLMVTLQSVKCVGTQVKSTLKSSILSMSRHMVVFNVFLEREMYTTRETLIWYNKTYLQQTCVMLPSINKPLVSLVMARYSIP